MKNEEMDIDRLRAFIKANTWIFAKTYAKTAPHEYTVKNPKDTKEFNFFVKKIREYISVTCPHCAEDFSLKRDDVLTRVE